MDTKKLRQKILDLAIRGKLVPQDPNDEPASVLLERIRAEKERLIKEGKIKRSKKSTSDTPHYENDVPFEVPEGWEWTTINDICSKIGSGSTPRGSNYAKEGIPFFRSQNVYNDGLVYDDIKYISEEVHENMIGTEVRAKDLLLNITGGSLGRCAIVPDEFQKGNVSQHVCILRTIIVLPAYLHLFIISDYFAATMILSGSGREGLPKYSLETMQFPLPPIEEQKRIVAAVNKWFALIDTLETAKEDLQTSITLAKSKILDLAIHGKLVPQDPNDEPAIELLKRINPKFTPCDNEFTPCDNGHYENVPNGWSEIKVGELAQYINGKAFQPSDWEQSGLPIVRIQNLNDVNCKYNYTSITHEKKYRITCGDLLFAWAASLGVYIWNGNDAWLNQHIFKVEPYPFIEKHFLYYLFKYLISEFYTRSHGSGMVHITKKEFETTIALLPPLSEQQRIVKSIESYYATLDNISANL